MKLYVYDHCPYCVRARMIFGLKNLAFEKIVLLNDNESTPVGLIGKKAVPILIKENGEAMPESLDIVKYVDENYGEKLLNDDIRPEISEWMKTVGSYYNHLLLPRFVRLGFIKKKTESIGNFEENFTNSDKYIARLTLDLTALDKLIVSANAANGKLSLEDIMLFPMLRNLTCVKGLKFPSNVAKYTERMAELSQIELYSDRAV